MDRGRSAIEGEHIHIYIQVNKKQSISEEVN